MALAWRRLALVAVSSSSVLLLLDSAPSGVPIVRRDVTPAHMVLHVSHVSPVAHGYHFGTIGPYEEIDGTIDAAIDPADPRSALITDLDRAPRDGQGLVSYSTDFAVLRPVDDGKWNRQLVFEVNNRGSKYALASLDDANPSNDPSLLEEAGNGYLLREGYALAWAGWEADVLPGNGRLTIRVPMPTDPTGAAITQRIAVEFHDPQVAPDGSTRCLPLSGSSDFASYPAVPPEMSTARLFVRPSDSAALPGAGIPLGLPVPSDRWSFQGTQAICLSGGFDPRFVYELDYVATDLRIMGLGYAATRDVVSFLRSRAEDDRGTPNPLGPRRVEHVLGLGISSSGMYLRDFMYQGFNEDLAGARVLDGVFILGAGAQKLFLNYRFAQPNPYSTEHADRYVPAVAFPFNFGVRKNPLVPDATAGHPSTDGILKRPRSDPLVIQVDTSEEYRQFQASLVDTDGQGHDVAEPSNARHFLLAGSQHTGLVARALPGAAMCATPANPTSVGSALRALFRQLDDWVTLGRAPSPSMHPTVASGSLVSAAQSSVGFPAVPDLPYAATYNPAGEPDFGPGVSQNRGVITQWGHPGELATYAVLVPRVDPVGIDLGGVRVPAVAMPTATLTGWTPRRDGSGAAELCGLNGMSIPLRMTPAVAGETADPRPSLEELYRSHAGYVAAVMRVVREQLAERLLLAEDAATAIELARASHILPH